MSATKQKLLIAGLVLIVSIGVYALTSGGAHGYDAGQLASEIKTEMQKNARESPDGKKVKVRTVECVIKSDQKARCFAELHDGAPDAAMADVSLSIDVTFDKDGDGYIYETEVA